MSPTPMTKENASHIQSAQAKAGHDMSSASFASRAQSAGDRNAAAAGNTGNNTGGKYYGGAGKGAGGNKK